MAELCKKKKPKAPAPPATAALIPQLLPQPQKQEQRPEAQQEETAAVGRSSRSQSPVKMEQSRPLPEGLVKQEGLGMAGAMEGDDRRESEPAGRVAAEGMAGAEAATSAYPAPRPKVRLAGGVWEEGEGEVSHFSSQAAFKGGMLRDR